MDAGHGDVGESVLSVDGLVDHDDADTQGDVEAEAEGREGAAVLRLTPRGVAGARGGGGGDGGGCHHRRVLLIYCHNCKNVKIV